MLANIVAAIVSVFNAYLLNSRYVFKQKSGNNVRPLIKTFTIYGFTFLLATGLLYIMVGILGISQWVAPLINLCITVPTNFLLSKFWVFR